MLRAMWRSRQCAPRKGAGACAWVLRFCDTVQVRMPCDSTSRDVLQPEVAGQSEADWLFRSSWPIKDRSSAFRSQPKCHTSLKRFEYKGDNLGSLNQGNLNARRPRPAC